MTLTTRHALVSLISAWLVYDLAIVLGSCAKAGLDLAIEAIWNAPRFRSVLGWYVVAQAVVVVNGAVLMKVIPTKLSRGVRTGVLILLHLGLAFVSAGLGVVCFGAVWKMTGP